MPLECLANLSPEPLSLSIQAYSTTHGRDENGSGEQRQRDDARTGRPHVQAMLLPAAAKSASAGIAAR